MELFRMQEIEDKEGIDLQNIDDLVRQIRRELDVGSKEAQQIARNKIDDAYDAGLVKAEEELGGNFGKDVATLDQLKKTNFNLINGFTNTQKKEMERILRNGVMNGEGAYNIADDISREFKTSTWRARTIARTEVIRASNMARLDGWKQSNVVKKKQWSTFVDDRTCPTCVDLDGRTVAINKRFNGQWQGETILRQMPPAHPNCYPEGTEVLTENGWKKFPNLDGEKIWSLNPETMEMELSDYNKYISYEYDGELIKFSNKWFELTVTPDHRMAYVTDWMAKHWDNPRVQISKASELNKSNRIPRTAKWKGKNPDKIKINGLEFNPESFMKFLGWYLSEGSVSECTKGQLQISIHQEGEKERKRIRKILNSIFDTFSESKNKFFIRSDKLGKYLMKLGHSADKYIPEKFKELDKPYLRAFLDEFVKGDGHIRKNKSKYEGNFKEERVYFTSSKQLADDIGELVLKVGNRPSYYLEKCKGDKVKFSNGTYETNNDQWFIRECRKDYAIKKNPKKVEYSGMVYDVELEKNHILYVRQNGSCCWSGNCRCSAVPIVESSSGIDIDTIMLGKWDEEDFPTTAQIEKEYGHGLVEAFRKAKNRIREIIINNRGAIEQ